MGLSSVKGLLLPEDLRVKIGAVRLEDYDTNKLQTTTTATYSMPPQVIWNINHFYKMEMSATAADGSQTLNSLSEVGQRETFKNLPSVSL